MKKLLALMLCGVMVLGGNVVTFAEAEEAAEAVEEPIVLNYEEHLDYDMYDGTWITCFGVFDLYLPSDWDVIYNWDSETEEVPEDGIFFQAGDSENGFNIAVTYDPNEEGETLETLAEQLDALEFEDIQYWQVNGIDALYCGKDNAVMLGAFGDQGGYYQVAIGVPTENPEDYYELAANILISFSATEYEEEE